MSAQESKNMASKEKRNEKNNEAIKYTIQLGAYQSNEDAIRFADGFRVRGYNPIISEIKVKNDRRYRVGLGIFDNVLEAKSYIEKEESLFQGQDYIIAEI